mmetsp:Transcript_4980/g.7811  ORF Transcript_4980/g.7811 Transcript_4980/m.7811 type:complete len:205 (-) Transcript_4980:81-695(-)
MLLQLISSFLSCCAHISAKVETYTRKPHRSSFLALLFSSLSFSIFSSNIFRLSSLRFEIRLHATSLSLSVISSQLSILLVDPSRLIITGPISSNLIVSPSFMVGISLFGSDSGRRGTSFTASSISFFPESFGVEAVANAAFRSVEDAVPVLITATTTTTTTTKIWYFESIWYNLTRVLGLGIERFPKHRISLLTDGSSFRLVTF